MADLSQYVDPYTAPYADPYKARIEELRKQQEQALSTPPKPMFTPEQEAQRAQQHQRMLQYGQLGAMSNDKAVQGMTSPLLKRAMEAMKPKYSEHGVYDETSGRFSYFPGYQENRRLEAINKNLQAAEQASARGFTEWQLARQRAEEQRLLRTTLAAMAANKETGSVTPAGTHETTGMPIYNHSRLGLVTRDPSGAWVRHEGRLGPKSTELNATAKKAYEHNLASLRQIDEVIAAVEANLAAVGPTAILPDMVSQYIPTEGGKGGVIVRAQVTNLAGLKIHDRSGAAVPKAEMDRLKPYIPNLKTDSPETILGKLRTFKTEYMKAVEVAEQSSPLAQTVRAHQDKGPTVTGRIKPAPYDAEKEARYQAWKKEQQGGGQ
jgi:hypothetical protein